MPSGITSIQQDAPAVHLDKVSQFMHVILGRGQCQMSSGEGDGSPLSMQRWKEMWILRDASGLGSGSSQGSWRPDPGPLPGDPGKPFSHHQGLRF